jgi:hypothetical protein
LSDIIGLIEQNEDILNKAFRKVSRFVERDDLLSEIFLLLTKHMDLSKVTHNHQFRQYMSKVAYQVTSLQLKAHSIPTSVISGGTSGSLRRMNYGKLEQIQKDIFQAARDRKDSSVDRSFENFDFYTDLNTKLSGNLLSVATFLSEGLTISEISKKIEVPSHVIRGRIIPKIRSGLTKRKV